jgi:hypothetical protein
MSLFKSFVGIFKEARKIKEARKTQGPRETHGGGFVGGKAIRGNMTPYQKGYSDGYKGRANRYAKSPDSDDPNHRPRAVARELSYSAPAPYKAGYQRGNADAIADRPYDEAVRKKP